MRQLAIRCGLVMIMLVSCLHAEVAAIHAGVDTTGLDQNRTRDMFLGRVTTWRDGSPVIIVLVDAPGEENELIKITGRSFPLLVRGWKRLVYAGNGAMPLTASSPQEALALVAKHNGAITILSRAMPDPRWSLIPLETIASH